MSFSHPVKEVAGWLTRASRDIERALQVAKRVSAQDGHDVGQIECGVRLAADGWNARYAKLRIPAKAARPVQTFEREPTERETLARLLGTPAGGSGPTRSRPSRKKKCKR